jgi:3-hydroxybutyryl-CoA dehydrogenase
MPSPHAPDLSHIAVIGAGTMGSGIALAALLADLKVALYDPEPSVLERAQSYIDTHLDRKKRAINRKYLRLAERLEEVGAVGVVIEAAPEDLSIKKELFARLETLFPEPVLLATNTSTLPVTAIGGATRTPGRVGGMHFFNPAPVMPLIEVVRGALTSEETVRALSSLARSMGKTPVIVRDTPGFIVNRVARPFYGEALRILGEGVATLEQIDRLACQGAGFRMGPFQLMDLIGIDINFAATRSIWEQTFYEARYRPHAIQVQMVHSGRLGRKTGQGFYTYDESGKQIDTPTASATTHIQAPGGLAARRSSTVVFSPGEMAPGLADLCEKAGYSLEKRTAGGGSIVAGLAVESAADGLARRLIELDRALPPEALLLCQCADVTLAEALSWAENPARVVGFDGLFFAGGQVVALVAGPVTGQAARLAAEEFCASLGKAVEWIADSPGLVLPRIVCALANEALFALGEGVAEAETIDRAMQLGANYPRGPVTWGKDLGYRRVVAVLDHLHQEFGEERYRAAPLLRKSARMEG